MNFLKRYPIPIAGLILGLFALGNLIQSYSSEARLALGVIALILYVPFLLKILILNVKLSEPLDNPVAASVFPTFTMATMLMAGYVKPYSPECANYIWYIGLIGHVILIIWFADDNIVKMASSFPIGMGKAQCLCGAVSGGQMALGIVYGRVKGQPMDPKMFVQAKALHDFVKEKYKSTCCRVMTRQWAGDNFMSLERKAHCIEITGVVTEWVANALIDDGKLAVPAE